MLNRTISIILGTIYLLTNKWLILNRTISVEKQYLKLFIAQSAGAVEYTDCTPTKV